MDERTDRTAGPVLASSEAPRPRSPRWTWSDGRSYAFGRSYLTDLAPRSHAVRGSRAGSGESARRATRAVSLAIVVSTLAGLVVALSAGPAQADGTVSLSASSVTVRQSITASGSGFPSGHQVYLVLYPNRTTAVCSGPDKTSGSRSPES